MHDPESTDQATPPKKVIVPEVLPPEWAGEGPPPGGSTSASDDLPKWLSKRRVIMAFIVAGISDAISFGTSVIAPVQVPLDIITAAVLFVVMGWRWPILLGLIMEAIPGVSMFPAWVMVVAAIVALGSPRPGVK